MTERRRPYLVESTPGVDGPGAQEILRSSLQGIAQATGAVGRHAEELVAREQRKRRRRLRLEASVHIVSACLMTGLAVGGDHPAIAAAVAMANVLFAVRAMIRLGRRG
jgi:hypothetical protein